MCRSIFRVFAGMRLLLKTVPPTGKTHSGTVIFFHGSGDTGDNILEWIRYLLGRDLQFPHIKMIYPTAPRQPYTPNGGQNSNVWFDRKSISIEALESRKSLSRMYEAVNELIKEEIDAGIPANRIIVGGFSMGGALAMHLGYHCNTELGGVFACSSFLNNKSIVYESLLAKKGGTVLPELLMFHGNRDEMVPMGWGYSTFEELQKLGVVGKFTGLPNTYHELKVEEMRSIEEWVGQKVPILESDLANKL